MSSKKPKVAKLQTMPTTVTTGFGTGSYNPATGNAGYTLDDQLAQFRDIFYGAAGDFLPSEQQQQYAQQVGQDGQTLFGNATNRDLQSQISEYYQKQLNMLSPERDRESARLADTQFSSGRLGYGTGTTGGYINPQQFALQQAREQQNAGLLLGAEDRARTIQQQDIARALGLADSAATLQMQPYQQASSLFGIGTGIEGLGMNTLNTVGKFAPIQAIWQQALQQNQQAINNAKAKGGLGGLFEGIGQAIGGLNSAFGDGWGRDLLKAGASWYTGGMSDATSMAGGVGKPDFMGSGYSDIRLKKNIKQIGKYKNGLNKYSFTYIWGEDSEGVIAQEVLDVMPEAVSIDNGFYKVNYDLIGE